MPALPDIKGLCLVSWREGGREGELEWEERGVE